MLIIWSFPTQLSSIGDMYSAASEHVLGLDGIAVIVNAGSPVNALGDPNGIGFVGLPYVHSAKAIAVAEKGARALQPTRLTVATELSAFPAALSLHAHKSPKQVHTIVRGICPFQARSRGGW
jgi:ABC-type phosphate transport system substrate-binding protein